jgi:aspartyl-tRNA(Asn)/glutamyl-tRNA(Gln) amidotransferase subunit A
VRRLIAMEFADAHERVDVILTPTVPFPAFRFEEAAMSPGGPARARMGRYSRLSNLTGFPALTIPCGFTAMGLPIGLQIMGRAFEDGIVLNLAHAYEQATTWRRRRPNIE